MKRLLPGRVECAVFIAMAVLAGIIVGGSNHPNSSVFFATLPIFLVGSLLGLRRNFALRQADEPEDSEPAA